MVQIVRPNALTLAGGAGWTTAGSGDSSTADAYTDRLDDPAAADATGYVISTSNPTDNVSTLFLELGDPTDPAVSTGHVIRARVRKEAGGKDLVAIIRLRAPIGGGNYSTLATLTTGLLSTTWQTVTLTLTGTEADSITDYAALVISINGVASGGGSGTTLAVTFVEFEVPDAVVGEQKSGTDAGTGGDAVAAAGRQTPESGSAVDAVATVARAIADAGSASEATATTAAAAGADAAAATESAAVTITESKTGGDTGSGSDTAAIAAAVSDVELAVGVEAAGLVAGYQVVDAAAGTDVGQAAAARQVVDAALGADVVQAAGRQVVEAAAAGDVIQAAARQTLDQGASAESAGTGAAVAAADAGSGTDAGTRTIVGGEIQERSAVDAATASDALVARAIVTRDTAAAGELASGSTTRTLTDAGLGADATMAVAPILEAFDTAVGGEDLKLVAAVIAGELAAGLDAGGTAASLLTDELVALAVAEGTGLVAGLNLLDPDVRGRAAVGRHGAVVVIGKPEAAVAVGGRKGTVRIS